MDNEMCIRKNPEDDDDDDDVDVDVDVDFKKWINKFNKELGSFWKSIYDL